MSESWGREMNAGAVCDWQAILSLLLCFQYEHCCILYFDEVFATLLICHTIDIVVLHVPPVMPLVTARLIFLYKQPHLSPLLMFCLVLC